MPPKKMRTNHSQPFDGALAANTERRLPVHMRPNRNINQLRLRARISAFGYPTIGRLRGHEGDVVQMRAMTLLSSAQPCPVSAHWGVIHMFFGNLARRRHAG